MARTQPVPEGKGKLMSSAELRVLAKKLAVATDPKKAARLKERLTCGFYLPQDVGDLEEEDGDAQ